MIKNNYLNLSSKNVVLLAASIFLIYPVNSFSGARRSDELSSIHREMKSYLIRNRICQDNRSCNDLLKMNSVEGSRIVISMYGQKEKIASASVAVFLIEHGYSLSNGKPISLKAYRSERKDILEKLNPIDNSEIIFTLDIDK